jgi:multimeric flavodoxin WrbA
MKVIGIVGSPRKSGNTDTLVQEALEGALQAGHSVEKYYLSTMNCVDCQACMYCKTHDECKQNDELSKLMEVMKEADGVVFGSPIYFRQFSGQFRLFVDRLYQFLNPDFSVRLPKGKKAIVIGSQGNPDQNMFDGVYKEFEGVLKLYGFNVIGEVRMSAGNPPSAVKDRIDLLSNARTLGKNL